MSRTTPDGMQCACVHHDAYECARIRDRVDYDDDNDSMKRACECACHKEDYDEDD